MNVVTDLETTPKPIRELYALRNDVEIDIRNIKFVIDTQTLRGKSEAMFHKEFALSMVAYKACHPIYRKFSNCR